MDFTIKRYSQLLHSLLTQGFLFLRVADQVGNTTLPSEKCIILRHDVDARPENSLRLARLEHALGIHGTYYFRIIPSVFDQAIIREIAGMGHEIGYHYETMSFIGDLETKRQRDDGTRRVDKAFERFVENLEKFRKIVPVTTICMHGSPLSRYDNRDIWKKYNYRDLGIVGDPYFDIDFSQAAYFTDTGRRWNGADVSIRDKVKLRRRDEETKRRRDIVTEKQLKTFPSYRSTQDMIRAIEKGTFPEMAMLTLHPQRWNDAIGPWIQELVWQNLKNVAKRGLRIWRSRFASLF
ncbi:MAG: hypothetical protein GXY59_03715 [Bacteroidales bacterium]|nr:hypothetical protein [Bacteroidales bacterium]